VTHLRPGHLLVGRNLSTHSRKAPPHPWFRGRAAPREAHASRRMEKGRGASAPRPSREPPRFAWASAMGCALGARHTMEVSMRPALRLHWDP
jgi:hypothetical protein